jgi:hypothetical protein
MAWAAQPTGKRGRPPVYTDAAVQACLTMKVLFGMALRQTTGFVESLLRLIGLDWDVPDFSTPSRRQKTLAVNIPHRGSQGPLHLLIDIEPVSATGSSEPARGIKVEGEGEWNARKHGGPKRRVWRKVHLGIDEQTLEIRAVEITSSDIGDAPMLPELLSQIPPDQEIASVTADGAYDTRKCHDAIAERGAHAVIPPRKNAKPWKAITLCPAGECGAFTERGHGLCVPVSTGGQAEALILGWHWSGDGLQTAGGRDLHLARDQGRGDCAEPCPVRGAVCRARLAQSEGIGGTPTSCGRVNQPLVFACFCRGFMIALTHADSTHHRPFRHSSRAMRGGAGVDGNGGGADGNHPAARAFDRRIEPRPAWQAVRKADRR